MLKTSRDIYLVNTLLHLPYYTVLYHIIQGLTVSFGGTPVTCEVVSSNVLRCFAPSLCLKSADHGTSQGQGQGQGLRQGQGQGLGQGLGQGQGQGQGRLDFKCHLWITTQLVSLSDLFRHILHHCYPIVVYVTSMYRTLSHFHSHSFSKPLSFFLSSILTPHPSSRYPDPPPLGSNTELSLMRYLRVHTAPTSPVAYAYTHSSEMRFEID